MRDSDRSFYELLIIIGILALIWLAVLVRLDVL